MGDQQVELWKVARFVQALISDSHHTKSFVAKWRSIGAKLDQLSSGLTAPLAAGSATIRDSLLRDLLQSISSTVYHLQELARFCSSEESYPGGKLLMCSNLDLAKANLDLHANSLAGIYSSGMLASHSNAIVVSKPLHGAAREEMSFYLKDLLSRLKIGDSEMKGSALTALLLVLKEDDNYVRIMMTDMPEFVNVLCTLVQSCKLGVKEGAAEAISALAGIDSFKTKTSLVAAGVISPLVRLLESGTDLGREKAAAALKKLTENSDNAWSVSAHGGVTHLLNICNRGGGGGGGGEGTVALVGSACSVLRNLMGVSEIREFMVGERAVSIFLKMLRSKEENLQIHSMEILQSISSSDDETKKQIVREGGIESLVRIVNPDSKSWSKSRETCLGFIGELCLSSTNSMDALIASGFLKRGVLSLLRNGEVPVQESALKLSCGVCMVSEEAKMVMGEVGFMTELVKLVDETRAVEMRELAAKALSCMVSHPKNRTTFVQEERNVSGILQVLNLQADEKSLMFNKLLLNALMSLSHSNSGRRKINASAYLKNLKQLAATDVGDAKRIVKKLSGNTNKLKTLFQWL